MTADAKPRRIGKVQLYPFVILLCAVTTLVFFGIGGAREYHRLLAERDKLLEISTAHNTQLTDARLPLSDQAAAWSRLFLSGAARGNNPEQFRDSEARAIAAVSALRDHFRQHADHASPDLIEAVAAQQAEMSAMSRRYAEALRRMSRPGANLRAIADETLGRVDRAAQLLLSRVADAVIAHQAERVEQIRQSVARAEAILLAGGLTTAALSCLFLLWRLQRIFAGPLARNILAAHRIAQGDLDTPVAADTGGGLKELTAALEIMRQSLLTYRMECKTALHETEATRDKLNALVTERMRELANSELQYGLTFERAGVGIAHISIDGKWLQVNERFCKLLGYRAGDLRGTGFQRFSLPGDQADERAALDALLDGRAESYSGEKRLVRKDGSLLGFADGLAGPRRTRGSEALYLCGRRHFEAKDGRSSAPPFGTAPQHDPLGDARGNHFRGRRREDLLVQPGGGRRVRIHGVRSHRPTGRYPRAAGVAPAASRLHGRLQGGKGHVAHHGTQP